jgi:glycosyltransferase involved in cell wall biosynthesis
MRAAVELRARELGLASRIRLTGFIPEEGVLATAFAQARLFVLPSEYEAFGLVLLEALAQGTPVIASRVGGIPEFIEDGRAGSLIPPQNAGALSDALLELWDDESARRKLGEYGRTEVVPRYSWPRMVDQLEALYGEVLIR